MSEDLSRQFGENFNEETLSGGKTLTTTDAVNQLLDPGGSNRDITLPAEGDSNELFFYFKNTADAAENLVIKDDGGSTIATVGQNEASKVVCDGTNWKTLGVWTITQS